MMNVNMYDVASYIVRLPAFRVRSLAGKVELFESENQRVVVGCVRIVPSRRDDDRLTIYVYLAT